jgi:hypothetical protein
VTGLCVLDHRGGQTRRAIDGLWLCTGHRRELGEHVTRMPARADDLETPGRGSGPRPRGSHADLAVDERAAAHRAHMTAVVASWCRVVAEDRGVTPPASASLARTCPWLLPHLDWCAGNRWVDEMLAELRDLTRKARAITDIPAIRVPLAAACLRHRDGERCTGQVTIYVRGDDWTARCTAEECEGVQDATPYLRVMQKGRGVTEADVIVMAARYGIAASPDVVRQWKHRGKIAAQTVGDAVWYDLASVQTYLVKRKTRRECVA